MTDGIAGRTVKASRQPAELRDVVPELSIIVPVFNEEASIAPFMAALTPLLDAITTNWEVLFINDGSRDATLVAIRIAHGRDSRVRGLDFSRNFGKEVALSAGLDHARGRAVIPMDVDLQDPPELIADMVREWRAGAEVVLARRSNRNSDTWLKRQTAQLFYATIARVSKTQIPTNVGDFRLIDRCVVDALRSYPERQRFMKGIFADVGFHTATVSYVRPARAHGETKFKPVHLYNLAVDGIISFSSFPLKIWTYIGFAVALVAMAYTSLIIVRTLVSGVDVPGYASLL
ncbi:MAG: glycosyltransferase family 2 protein, partial [Polymorphobacter sp.]